LRRYPISEVSELGILVLDGMEAMGTVRDECVKLHRAEDLEISLREGLIEILLAKPSRRVAAAPFLRKHPEGKPCSFHEGHERAGDLLFARIIGGDAADPIEVVHCVPFLKERYVEAVEPLHAIFRRS